MREMGRGIRRKRHGWTQKLLFSHEQFYQKYESIPR